MGKKKRHVPSAEGRPARRRGGADGLGWLFEGKAGVWEGASFPSRRLPVCFWFRESVADGQPWQEKLHLIRAHQSRKKLAEAVGILSF